MLSAEVDELGRLLGDDRRASTLLRTVILTLVPPSVGSVSPTLDG